MDMGRGTLKALPDGTFSESWTQVRTCVATIYAA